MNWEMLSHIGQLEDIKQLSFTQPVAIFKHSTRCSISAMVKSRLERMYMPSGIRFYYLDLLAHRDISNAIAATFQVRHESPQVLLIKNGVCIFDESHNGIDMEELISKSAA